MRRIITLAAGACLLVAQLASVSRAGAAQTTKVTAKLHHVIESGVLYWWSPDGKTLAVASAAPTTPGLSLYDAATGKVRAEVRIELPPPPPTKKKVTPPELKGVFFTPDSSTLVVHFDRVIVYDARDGKFIRQFAQGSAPANLYARVYKPYETTSTSYNSDGTTTETTTTEYPSDKQELRELPTRYISDRVVSPDSALLLVRDTDEMKVYELGTGTVKFTLKPVADAGLKKGEAAAGEPVGEFSPDGRRVVTTHRNRTPRLWDAATGGLVADLAPQSDTVYGARFSRDGRFVVTTSFDGVVKVWDAAAGKLLHTVGSTSDPTYFVQWNPANNNFVAKTLKWEGQVWSAETGKLVCKLDTKATKEKFDDNLTFIFSPDGKALLTQAKNDLSFKTVMSKMLPVKGKIRTIAHLWDAETGALTASLRDDKPRSPTAYRDDKFFWSPAGDFVVTAGRTVKLWSRRGELMQELASNALLGSSLSPDGEFLAVTDMEPFLESFAATIVEIAKIMVGKLPKDTPPKTFVWKIETGRAPTAAPGTTGLLSTPDPRP